MSTSKFSFTEILQKSTRRSEVLPVTMSSGDAGAKPTVQHRDKPKSKILLRTLIGELKS